MKEYKTMDEILEHAPKLTNDDVQELNEWYRPYLFYNDDKKNGVQHCTCTSCRESFDVPYVDRLVPPERIEFLQAGHNQTVRCPKCGRTVQKKQKGRAKYCHNLWEYQRLVFVKPISYNEVYLIYIWSTKGYDNGTGYIGYLDYAAVPEYEVNAIYYITPNQQRCFIKSPWGIHRWEEKSIREPFLKTWWYNVTAWKRGYGVVGDTELKNTFLKYYDDNKMMSVYFEGFKELNYYYANCIEYPFCKALCRFARYPSMEWLLKQGYDDFVFYMMYDGKEASSLFDWSAKSPFGFFKTLTTPEIKSLKAEGRLKRNNIRDYNRLKKIWPKLTAEQFGKICELTCLHDRARYFLKYANKYKFKISDFIKYFKRRSSWAARDWLDYLNMAEKIGFDLNVHNVLFPKNLKKAHDEAVKIKNQIELEEELKALKDKENKYLKRFQTLCDKYSFADETYKVRVPIGAREIINEGNALQHCVGDYAERHLTGKTTILFIRLCKEKDKPLLTVEIDDKTLNIRQVHGLRNRNPDKVEQAFIDMWMAYVVKPKTKTKKNKKAAEAA